MAVVRRASACTRYDGHKGLCYATSPNVPRTSVGSSTTPAFTYTPISRVPISRAGSGVSAGGFSGGGSLGTPGFSTPAPAITGAAPGAASAGAVPASAAGIAGALGVGGLAALALLTAPFWAIGSRRFADHVLGAAGSSCPDGLDRPLDPGRA